MLMFCWILKEEPRKILTAASDEARYCVRPFTAQWKQHAPPART